MGIQTSAVLGRAKGGGDLATVALKYFAHHPDGAAGNGSLMRTAPVALAHLGHDDAIAEAARQISSLTHAGAEASELVPTVRRMRQRANVTGQP